jgi:hypothetical protein
VPTAGVAPPAKGKAGQAAPPRQAAPAPAAAPLTDD